MLTKHALTLAMALSLGPFAQADLIDFEAFAPGTSLGPVVTATNTVTFAVGGGAPAGPATVVGVGSPIESFFPGDTPAGGTPGARFLNDSAILSGGVALNYYLVFATPVSNLSLEIYDFGDIPGGGTVTLTTYTDPGFTTSSGSSTLPGSALDASVIPISVAAGLSQSASLVFTGFDAGVGVDNVAFDTVPEPMTVTLLGAGLLGLGWIRRRRNRP